MTASLMSAPVTSRRLPEKGQVHVRAGVVDVAREDHAHGETSDQDQRSEAVIGRCPRRRDRPQTVAVKAIATVKAPRGGEKPAPSATTAPGKWLSRPRGRRKQRETRRTIQVPKHAGPDGEDQDLDQRVGWTTTEVRNKPSRVDARLCHYQESN